MENEKTFTEIMDALVAECESVLKKYLPDPRNMPEGEQYASLVAEAMQYSAMAGGKRLRPLLIARICDMYGGRRELAEPFMAALEMIHNYSLVHDDLPAMDDDDYRRGRKTTHIVFGVFSCPDSCGNRCCHQISEDSGQERGNLRNGGRPVRRPGSGKQAGRSHR